MRTPPPTHPARKAIACARNSPINLKKRRRKVLIHSPASSIAAADASWMRSAQPTSGCLSLMGCRRWSAFTRPALAAWLISGSKRMEAVAPPRLRASATHESDTNHPSHNRLGYIEQQWSTVRLYKGKGQPGKVANPARGQLNRENEIFPCPR